MRIMCTSDNACRVPIPNLYGLRARDAQAGARVLARAKSVAARAPDLGAPIAQDSGAAIGCHDLGATDAQGRGRATGSHEVGPLTLQRADTAAGPRHGTAAPGMPKGTAARDKFARLARRGVPEVQPHRALDIEELRDAVFAHLSLQDRVLAARVSHAWAETALRPRAWKTPRILGPYQLNANDSPRFVRPKDGLAHYDHWRRERRWQTAQTWIAQAQLTAMLTIAAFAFVRIHAAFARSCYTRGCGANPVCNDNPITFCDRITLAPAYFIGGMVVAVALSLHAGLRRDAAALNARTGLRAPAAPRTKIEPYAQLRAAARLQQHLIEAVGAGDAPAARILLESGACPNASIRAQFWGGVLSRPKGGQQPLTLLRFAIDSAQGILAQDLLMCGALFTRDDVTQAHKKLAGWRSIPLMEDAIDQTTVT